MTDDEQFLPNDIEQLKAMLLAEREQSAQQAARLVFLEEQFRLAQQQRFGAQSESHPAQGDLFNEAEVELDVIEDVVESTSTTVKKKPVRQKLPKDLEREVIIHDLSDDEKSCDCCGNQLHQMGESRSEKLEFIPAKVKVIEHVRLKYSCRTCEKEGINTKIKSAPIPPSPIPKGFATPSLLSQIITSKYQYALPLYRQESLFKQYGIALSRKTMSEWMMKCSELFKPLYAQLQKTLLQQRVIQADETTLKVIKEDKAKCYMWLYCTGSDAPTQNDIPNIVLYDYQSGRAGQCAVDYLDGYTGYLQVDGYVGYEKTKATLAGCWAHARRKFKEAEIAQPKGKTGKANMALNHIQKLYRLEIQLKDKTSEEKYQGRQEKAKPLLAQFYQWLEKTNVPPKTALGKAIQYCKNQWHKLNCYIEDGELNIDNNRAERAVKPFVIGRKNWMFSNTANGARASAMLYSIIETAKANGLIPFDYLMHCLEQLTNSALDIETLLPWNVKLS
ncbi:IS66 family transposase [Candidatus Colwellia aromaticivorans]|uniref:IS66 family transposase n=1 Tax=Candidatus Colwellia aromaticivorans TaxID=2267621 RepID=UPI000DF42EF9|nr:IS66 family transposase [Candidatus Colwellia aromaticivorans]